MPADRSRAGTALAPVPSVPPGGPADASAARSQPGEPSGPTGRPQLDASTLLSVWEEGAALDPTRRALGLLSAAWPGTGPEHWLQASVGRRDGWLLTLREKLFGNHLETVAACPACGAQLEIALRTGDVRVPVTDVAGAPPVRVETDGYRVEGRPPTSADLIEVLSAPDTSMPRETGPDRNHRHAEAGTTPDRSPGGPSGSSSPSDPSGPSGPSGPSDPSDPSGQQGALEVPAALLRRCIVTATRGSVDVDPAGLPPAVIEAVAKAMADADPQADVRLAFDCPDCGHRWSSPFDILSYLWDEIDDWATRLLREVHALASAYGWSEHDILGMSALRRRLYLEMCGVWA